MFYYFLPFACCLPLIRMEIGQHSHLSGSLHPAHAHMHGGWYASGMGALGASSGLQSGFSSGGLGGGVVPHSQGYHLMVSDAFEFLLPKTFISKKKVLSKWNRMSASPIDYFSLFFLYFFRAGRNMGTWLCVMEQLWSRQFDNSMNQFNQIKSKWSSFHAYKKRQTLTRRRRKKLKDFITRTICNGENVGIWSTHKHIHTHISNFRLFNQC